MHLGKSFFLAYLRVRRLLVYKAICYRLNDHKCVLFTENNEGQKVNIEVLCNLEIGDEKSFASWQMKHCVMHSGKIGLVHGLNFSLYHYLRLSIRIKTS